MSHPDPIPTASVSQLRVPPHSAEAEQSVLGGILLSPSTLDSVDEVLSEDDFFRRDHRLIYRAIQETRLSDRTPDTITVGEYLEANGQSETVSTGYLIELASNTPSAANILAYANIVKEKSNLRRLIEAGTAIVNYGFSPEGQDATDIYHRSLSAITSIEPALTNTQPPTDLFGEAPATTLRKEWLPPPIQELVFAASAVKGSPPEVMALSMLVACAAACDDRFQVQPRANEPGWRESARLWGVVVGDPSSKKTPAMKLAMRSLSETNHLMLEKSISQRAEYERQVKLFNLQEKKALKAESNGDGLPEKQEAPKPPRMERIITNDGTTEGITKLLADNERGLLYYTDELTSWLGGMGRYSANGGAADRAFWLECYQGGSKVVDRASAPPVRVPNLSVNVIGSIQPDRIRALASKMDDDGLLQRCMVAVIPTAERRPTDDPEPVALIQAYDEMLRQIYNTRAETQCIVSMSPDADLIRREMDDWRVTIVASDGLPPMLRSAVAKYEGLFPRLCLTFHVMSCAATKRFPTSLPITEATARRAADFIRRYLFPNAVTFYAGLMGGSSPGFDLAKKIADYLLAASPSRITRRDLTQYVTSWRDRPEWQQNQALLSLEQAGWLFADQKPGKQSKAWTLNPMVSVQFAERAATVKRKRAEIAKVMEDLRSGGKAG